MNLFVYLVVFIISISSLTASDNYLSPEDYFNQYINKTNTPKKKFMHKKGRSISSKANIQQKNRKISDFFQKAKPAKIQPPLEKAKHFTSAQEDNENNVPQTHSLQTHSPDFRYLNNKTESKVRVNSTCANQSQDDQQITLRLISGNNDHYELLLDLIDQAREEIFISSYKVNYLPEELLYALGKAKHRKVHIHVYYGIHKEIPEFAEKYFENSGFKGGDFKTHSKPFMVDRKHVVIGSHNWLDLKNDETFSLTNDDTDKSIMITNAPEITKKIAGRIWQDTISYRDGNEPSFIPYQRNILNSSKILLLTTLTQHEDFLINICQDVHYELIIYSPFFTFLNAKKRLSLISDSLNDKPFVRVKLFLRDERDIEQLMRYINKIPNLKTRTTVNQYNGHQKTLLADDNLRAEGSFNWLSSAANEESEYSNHDITVAIMGKEAVSSLVEI